MQTIASSKVKTGTLLKQQIHQEAIAEYRGELDAENEEL